jgi:hypothetical protein
MILELADIRIHPGKQAEFDAAIVGGRFASPPAAEHFTLLTKSA